MKTTNPFIKLLRWIEDWRRKPFSYIGNAMYWLRTHTYNKYHMVDCRNPRNGYNWGWKDRSELFLFANIAILNDFVEKESGLDCHIDWRAPEEVDDPDMDNWEKENRKAHAHAAKEMKEIYRWWNHDRKLEHDAYDKALDEAYKDRPLKFGELKNGLYEMEMNSPPKEVSKALWKMEESLDNKDNEMLDRLLKIRHYMWT
jgi:hypothetical protein